VRRRERSLESQLAATLAQLHDVDVDRAGLGDLARHDHYIERQLRSAGAPSTSRCTSKASSTVVWSRPSATNSRASIPTQQRVSVVHGDYRLDNTVLDEHGAVRAILDWEICTWVIPWPTSDCCSSTGPSRPTRPRRYWAPPLRLRRGFASRARYSRRTPRTRLDVSDVAYYQAFGYWKLACILQGVFARYSAGATAGDQGSVAEFPKHIAMLAETAKMNAGEMMDDEIYDHIIFLADPELSEPVLVVSLEGWIDAGLGASNAIGPCSTRSAPRCSPPLIPSTSSTNAPGVRMARIVDGITTELTWPEIQLRYGRDGDGADILFLVGPEPDFHWSDFVDVVTDAAGRFDVRLVVGLGAFPAPTPHTRPVRVIATAPRGECPPVAHHRHRHGRARGSGGHQFAALELGFAEVDMEIVTLWARVPHYVASMPYPQASAALIDGLARIAGLTLDASHLRASADEARQRVDDLVTNNPEHSSMVEQLEEAADETEGTSLSEELPSGDELAAELERFLRGESS
jgi:proteasome assembly chaperone (PAC2) family protein